MEATADILARVTSRLRAAGCVFAEEEARMVVAEAAAADELETLVSRRAEGEPLEYVLGWAAFCGLRIAVGPGVFVPRRRTEFLAREAAAFCRPRDIVVDLCCGSGALGAALLSLVGGLDLHAADVDPLAVMWAGRNLAARAEIHLGDLYEALPGALRGRVRMIVANAPYVPSAAVDLLPREARLYEPSAALQGGSDGLDVQRRVVRGAPRWLAPGGRLLVETGARQADATAEEFARCGLSPRILRSEELDATVVSGSLPPG